MKSNKIILEKQAEFSSLLNMFASSWAEFKVAFSLSRLPQAAWWRLAITVDRLQQLPHEYSCLSYFISFQTWFHVKTKP